MAQDLQLKQTDGLFDIVVGEQDFGTVDGLETSIAVLLFTDARADESQINDPSRRRGWVGNILRDTDLGGMLWLMSQTRNTQDSRNRISIWARKSLQPLIDQNIASQIIVNIDKVDVRGAELSVEIIAREGDTLAFSFWLKTDLRNLTDDS